MPIIQLVEYALKLWLTTDHFPSYIQTNLGDLSEVMKFQDGWKRFQAKGHLLDNNNAVLRVFFGLSTEPLVNQLSAIVG